METSQKNGNGTKIMRKGTRACRECRRRKVRCIYPDDDQTVVCHECSEHGRTCVKQGFVRGDEDGTSSRRIRLKVARLESAVQRLAREGSGTSIPNALSTKQDPMSAASRDKWFAHLDERFRTHNPLFQLFSNDAWVDDSWAATFDASKTPPAVSFPKTGLSDREKLLSTISGIDNMNALLQHSGEWVSWRDQHFALKKAASQQTLSDFVTEKLAEESPLLVAVGLLTITMILQLDPDVNAIAPLLPQPPAVLVDKINSAIDQLILDSDTYRGRPDIVLVFMLRAKQHAEMSQLRKSWLRVRQAIDAAQDVGFGSGLAVKNGSIENSSDEQQRFVGGIMEVFAFMSMFLGFPHATDSNFTDVRALNVLLNDTSDWDLKSRALRRVVSVAAGRVNDKNGNHDNSEMTTESIQSTLDLAALNMPLGWWDFTAHPIWESWRRRHEDLTIQLWFWTVQTFLHLPSLIEDTPTPATLRSRQYCLDACRSMVRLFNYLRTQPSLSIYVCNCDDFQGLIGGCIIMVGVLQSLAEQPSGTAENSTLNGDLQLVDELKEIFQYRVHLHGGNIVQQGLKILDQLTWYAYGGELAEDSSSPEVQSILLPYFGTINVQLVKNIPRVGLQPPSSVPTDSANQLDGIESSPVHTKSSTNMNCNGISYGISETDYSNNAFNPPESAGFENMPAIDWETWDRFLFNDELQQDWNPALTFELDAEFLNLSYSS